MIYKLFLSVLFVSVFYIAPVNAQFVSQREAAYFAVLKAVADYKLNDEEHKDEVDQLREDERFNKKLANMMEKLTNKKSKNSQNQKIYKILFQAGKQIYNELN